MDSSLDLRSVTPAELVKTYINNTADLLDAGGRLLPGERIELFFALAANRPEVALPAFLTILRDIADPNYRALALRGLGQIVHPETVQEIRACATESAQELVQMLASELLGKGQYSNDLTRWAASDAITNLNYPDSVLRSAAFGGLMETPDRIQRELTGRWLSRQKQMQRFDSQNHLTAEYERYLDFWAFGPVDRLFRESILDREDIAQLLKSQGFRGLEQAFSQKENNSVLVDCAYAILQDHCKSYPSSNNRVLEQNLSRFLKDSSDSETAVHALTNIISLNISHDLPPALESGELDDSEVFSRSLEVFSRGIDSDIKEAKSWTLSSVNCAVLRQRIVEELENYHQSLFHLVKQIESAVRQLTQSVKDFFTAVSAVRASENLGVVKVMDRIDYCLYHQEGKKRDFPFTETVVASLIIKAASQDLLNIGRNGIDSILSNHKWHRNIDQITSQILECWLAINLDRFIGNYHIDRRFKKTIDVHERAIERSQQLFLVNVDHVSEYVASKTKLNDFWSGHLDGTMRLAISIVYPPIIAHLLIRSRYLQKLPKSEFSACKSLNKSSGVGISAKFSYLADRFWSDMESYGQDGDGITESLISSLFPFALIWGHWAILAWLIKNIFGLHYVQTDGMVIMLLVASTAMIILLVGSEVRIMRKVVKLLEQRWELLSDFNRVCDVFVDELKACKRQVELIRFTQYSRQRY